MNTAKKNFEDELPIERVAELTRSFTASLSKLLQVRTLFLLNYVTCQYENLGFEKKGFRDPLIRNKDAAETL